MTRKEIRDLKYFSKQKFLKDTNKTLWYCGSFHYYKIIYKC